MARRYHELRRHVRFWHLADIDAGAEHVRFRGEATSLIRSLMSANDPKRTFAQVTNSNSLCCNGNIGHWSNMLAGRVLTHLDIQVVVHNVDWIRPFCAIC